MKKKGLVAVFGMVLALALISSPVWAWDSSEFTKEAQGMQGDLLIYPLYIAGDGLNTNFAVINSSPTESVVAKVILRSHKYSQEVLDFLIFLSPNDYFDATISYLNGKYVLTSTDDSFIVGGVAASETVPITVSLSAPCDGVVDTAGWGYIEVVESWSTASLTGSDRLDVEADGTVKKENIVAAYPSGPYSKDDTINTLSGFAEVNIVGAHYAAYNATALMDYSNLTKLIVGPETYIGDNARNKLVEVEAALAKDNLVIPYYSTASAGTLPILTFPTKLSLCPAQWADSDVGEARGEFFYDNYFDPIYTLTYYDKKEHFQKEECLVSPCVETSLELKEEVNLVFLNAPFDAGWVRASFPGYTTGGTAADTRSGVGFAGAPLIGLLAHFTPNGFTLIPPAYTPANIARVTPPPTP